MLPLLNCYYLIFTIKKTKKQLVFNLSYIYPTVFLLLLFFSKAVFPCTAGDLSTAPTTESQRVRK